MNEGLGELRCRRHFLAVTCVRGVQLSFIHKNETFTEFVRKK